MRQMMCAVVVLGILCSGTSAWAQTTVDANGVFDPRGCEAARICPPLAAGAPVTPVPVKTTRPLSLKLVATNAVKAHCEQEWPTDFRMQAYCQRRAAEAAQELTARTMETPDRRTIRTQCLSEWSADLPMLNYCEKQQLEALQQLGRER